MSVKIRKWVIKQRKSKEKTRKRENRIEYQSRKNNISYCTDCLIILMKKNNLETSWIFRKYFINDAMHILINFNCFDFVDQHLYDRWPNINTISSLLDVIKHFANNNKFRFRVGSFHLCRVAFNSKNVRVLLYVEGENNE